MVEIRSSHYINCPPWPRVLFDSHAWLISNQCCCIFCDKIVRILLVTRFSNLILQNNLLLLDDSSETRCCCISSILKFLYCGTGNDLFLNPVILIVVYFLAHAFIRIVRMPNPPWKEWKTIKNRAVEVYKKPVELSFVLKLKEDSTQIPDCVTFHLKTNRPARIKLYWGVSVTYIFELMRCSWNDFNEAVSNPNGDENVGSKKSKSLVDFCQAIVDCPLEESDDGTFDDMISVSPPANLKWKDLVNKYRYPLAIVVYRPENTVDTNESFESGEEIHGLFTLLHVKSDTFPMPTTVLAHYIKMDNGNTFLLKPLYLVEDDTLLDDESANQENAAAEDLSLGTSPNSFPGVSCSVCQTLPVSRAILPCGHVCLCVQCFEKVERCPICRGEMQFFFRTRDEDYATNLRLEPEVPRNRSWFEFFEDVLLREP
ncbi:unnamed protein product [Allacma fusca]|uniref:RING-type domain-containing protein n=1 Tax=Allacma fusca TaxID=39272 RepID=A0A8J2NI09_9HEXA|nr:unnamed protein product [Allacma fusca]